jgi:hypothetical protein
MCFNLTTMFGQPRKAHKGMGVLFALIVTGALIASAVLAAQRLSTADHVKANTTTQLQTQLAALQPTVNQTVTQALITAIDAGTTLTIPGSFAAGTGTVCSPNTPGSGFVASTASCTGAQKAMATYSSFITAQRGNTYQVQVTTQATDANGTARNDASHRLIASLPVNYWQTSVNCQTEVDSILAGNLSLISDSRLQTCATSDGFALATQMTPTFSTGTAAFTTGTGGSCAHTSYNDPVGTGTLNRSTSTNCTTTLNDDYTSFLYSTLLMGTFDLNFNNGVTRTFSATSLTSVSSFQMQGNSTKNIIINDGVSGSTLTATSGSGSVNITVNGASSGTWTTTNLTTYAANDTVVLSGVTMSSSTINLGEGNNNIALKNMSGGSITTGNGNDALFITSNATGDITLGNGNNILVSNGLYGAGSGFSISGRTVQTNNDQDFIYIKDSISGGAVSAGGGYNFMRIGGCAGTTSITGSGATLIVVDGTIGAGCSVDAGAGGTILRKAGAISGSVSAGRILTY